MSFTENAMAVKARAMFGERLKAQDYQTLLQKKSVGDIAEYLKSSTLYAESLEGINAKAVHRGQLEHLLRMDVFGRLSRLLRYSGPSSKQFVYLTVMQSEITQIVMAIRCLYSQDPTDRLALISKMPIYVEKYMSFDLRKLADVTSFEELLELIKGTVYYEEVKQYATRSMKEMDFTGLEHTMKLNYYETVLKTIHQYAHGVAKEKMMEIYKTAIELANITVVYRMKKYFDASSKEILRLIWPQYYHFTAKDFQRMCETETAEQVLEELQNSAYKKYVDSSQFLYIEHYTKRILFHMNSSFMERYMNPDLVLLSYLLLTETEIQNVIDVIEGVRYGVGIEQVKPLLIY